MTDHPGDQQVPGAEETPEVAAAEPSAEFAEESGGEQPLVAEDAAAEQVPEDLVGEPVPEVEVEDATPLGAAMLAMAVGTDRSIPISCRQSTRMIAVKRLFSLLFMARLALPAVLQLKFSVVVGRIPGMRRTAPRLRAITLPCSDRFPPR